MLQSKFVMHALGSVVSLCLLGASACTGGGAGPDGAPEPGDDGFVTGGSSALGAAEESGSGGHAGHDGHPGAASGSGGSGGATGPDPGHGGADHGSNGGDDEHGGESAHSTGGTDTGHGGEHAATGGTDGHSATGGTGGGHAATGGTGGHPAAGTGAGGHTASGGSAGDEHGTSGGPDGGGTGGTGHAGTDHGGTTAAGSGGGGTSGASGSGAGSGGTPHEHDHCVDGELPDARDALLATPSAPDIFVASNGDVDLPVPGAVLDWMDERFWKPSHDAWHNIRRCGRGSSPGGEGTSSGSAAMCAHTELVPEDQECENAANGLDFLVMHRHMLIALRQAFPQHADLFDGFPHFPFQASDVPEAWRSRFGSGWTQNVVNTARTLEDIENNLSRFPTEGDLGKYIQCGMQGVTSIHGALHFKWVVNESPNSLGKQSANLGNYMFWKLHGWIDGIWERYRVAKGLAPDEPALVSAITAQCREMHALAAVIEPDETGEEPLPEEHGFFHENVRPAFERLCSTCHDDGSPEAGMSLGGHISSANVVANLVNVPSAHGGQFMRVVPGHPEQSWVYLKASGLAASAGCEGNTCNSQSMPPGATADRRLTAAELGALEQWILDGAPPPTP
ncbi:MAG TPA: hypothetical protein VGK73_05365 [Polyangiaceae bacterium]